MQTFTKTEQDAILHRLEAQDAIVERFMDTMDDEPPCPWLPEEIEAAVDSLTQRVESDRWDGLTDLEKVILKNCIEGSLWPIAGEDCGSPTHRRRIRQLRVAAKKVEELVGEPCSVPTA